MLKQASKESFQKHIRSYRPTHTTASADMYGSVGHYQRMYPLFPSKASVVFFGRNLRFLRRKVSFCPDKIITAFILPTYFPFRALFPSKQALANYSKLPSKQALANYSKPTINVIQTGVLMTYEIFMYFRVDTTI